MVFPTVSGEEETNEVFTTVSVAGGRSAVAVVGEVVGGIVDVVVDEEGDALVAEMGECAAPDAAS